MKELSKQYYNIKRRFEDRDFVFYLYVTWAAVSFFGLGFFAVKPSFINIIGKRQTINELKIINENLKINIATADRLKNSILVDEGTLANLNEAMPDTYSVEQFILQFEEAVASSGYILTRLGSSYVGSKDSGVMELTVEVKGPGRFELLVKNIESLKRLTTLVDYNYRVDTHSSVKGDSNIILHLTIYAYGGTK